MVATPVMTICPPQLTPLEALGSSPNQQPGLGAPTEGFPELKFDSSQSERFEKSAFETFKEWVKDNWGSITQFASIGFMLFASFLKRYSH